MAINPQDPFHLPSAADDDIGNYDAIADYDAIPDEETASPWEWYDAYEDRSTIPHNDGVTGILIDRAVETLVWIRCPLGSGDPAPTLSALVSLAAEIEIRFDETVADARDHGYSWDDIAQRMAITPRTARRRYAAYTDWRRKGCPWPIPT